MRWTVLTLEEVRREKLSCNADIIAIVEINAKNRNGLQRVQAMTVVVVVGTEKEVYVVVRCKSLSGCESVCASKKQ